MVLEKIALHSFRNRGKGTYDISPQVTIIIGENAKGKTNLLESVYFLINGVGFRETREEELIELEKDQTAVEGRFRDGESVLVYKIVLNHKHNTVEKTYFIERTKKNHRTYLENQTKAVLFAPEQIDVITGSPDERRSYFNRVISQYDFEYKKKVLNLENALRRRNKILEKAGGDEDKLRDELNFWNTYIIEQSAYITQKREEYTTYLNNHSSLDHKRFGIAYVKNEATQAKFEEVYNKERLMRRTVIGPQKDDFEFYILAPRKKNIQHYGSRSEQRLGIFWLKMNEIFYFEDMFHKKPILLLDDIFSEFDHANKHMILALIQKYQTILTTTEKEIVEYIDSPKVIIQV